MTYYIVQELCSLIFKKSPKKIGILISLKCWNFNEMKIDMKIEILISLFMMLNAFILKYVLLF